MLIKINNSDSDFAEQVEKLKSRFDVGTSSGASTQAIYRFMALESDYNDLSSKYDDLLAKVEEVQQALLQRSKIDVSLNSFCNIDFD